jgi:peptidoglycan/LPS O-acetylase OafA/YrhL
MRAVAILLVLFAHTHSPGDDWLPVRTLKGRCGFLGVQLFFVLSGFLITTLMLREVARSKRLDLGRFYLRRILRIIPAYLAYLAVLAALQLCGRASLNGRAWLALGTYTVNFLPSTPVAVSHIWSLSVEEHFYLLWPLLMAGLTLASCRQAAFACVGVALALRWLALFFGPDHGLAIDLWTFTRLDDIAVGCLLAFAARDADWRRRLHHLGSNRLAPLVPLAVLVTGQVFFSRRIGGRLFDPFVLRLVLGLANAVNSWALAALMWVVLARPGGVWARLLSRPVLAFLGVISYSLYLWHPLFCLDEFGPLAAFPLNLVCVFAAGLLSYGVVERPFLRLKDRLSDPAKPPVAPAPPWKAHPRRRPALSALESLPTEGMLPPRDAAVFSGPAEAFAPTVSSPTRPTVRDQLLGTLAAEHPWGIPPPPG